MKKELKMQRLKEVDFLNLFVFCEYENNDSISTMVQSGAFCFNGESYVYKYLIRKIKYVYNNLEAHVKHFERRHEKRLIAKNLISYSEALSYLGFYNNYTKPHVDRIKDYLERKQFSEKLNKDLVVNQTQQKRSKI